MRYSDIAQWALPLALVPLAAALEDVGDKPRRYEHVITWEKGSPDGVEREMAFINGMFPGPVVELNQGDNVEIVVQNKMPFNTSIHFHGIEQRGTPWSDGVPGLTQRYIMPGKNFTYKWTATQYGAFWYHAHARGQIDDGIYGAIQIHPKDSTPDPFSLIAQNNDTLQAMKRAVRNVKPIVLSDWRHIPSADAWKINIASGMDTPCYDSILINGKGRVDCMSRQQLSNLLSAPQRIFLQQGNAQQMTDKGCLPAKVIAATLDKSYNANLTQIPDSIFETCTSTQGQMAVVPASQASDSSESWHAFDVIGTFGLLTSAFSIDEHQMYVYAVDGGYIQPQLVEAISVANADRYSVLIKTDRTGDFGIRVASVSLPQIISTVGTLRISANGGSDNSGNDTNTNNANTDFIVPNTPSKVRRQAGGRPQPSPTASSTPTSTPYINDAGTAQGANVNYFSQQGQRNYPAQPISQTVDQTFKLKMTQDGSDYKWALNGSIYPLAADNAEPLLFDPKFNRKDHVTISTKNNTWIDLIFESSLWPMPPHPVHKHGSHMWLLGTGQGNFTWDTVAEAAQARPGSFNLQNPPKRDAFQSLPAINGPAWLAVRYHSSDPGPWMMHCHIQSHLEGGMAMVVQDGIDTWPTVPKEYLNMA